MAPQMVGRADGLVVQCVGSSVGRTDCPLLASRLEEPIAPCSGMKSVKLARGNPFLRLLEELGAL